ncbi:MAG: hypothetical protein L3K03_08175 [Thermoplasmata archaeon]|nr:hypothetical protein [Thermoplasmata archaeon]
MARPGIPFGSWGAVVLIALLLLPALPNPAAPAAPSLSSGSSVAGARIAGSTAPTVTVNLTVTGNTPIHLSNQFWGTTVSPRAHLLPLEGELVNATPTQIIVWPGGNGGDEYDPLTNTLYNVSGNSTPTVAVTTEQEFVQWCESIHCSAIMQVPAEIDNATIAAQIVNYTENGLGFHPNYWEIGNEPELWEHWDVPWTRWNDSVGQRNITPTQYAWEVDNYTTAMRLVDPAVQVIGIAATGRSDGSLWNASGWIDPTIAVDGPNLSAVAFHAYPAGTVNHSAVSVAQFYGTIAGSAGLPAQITLLRNTIATTTHAACPSCRPVPLFVTELGAALYHYQDSAFSVGFPGALDFAAQITQAITLNEANVDLYGAVSGTSNSWFNLTGSQRSDYTLYSQIFTHLGSVAYPSQFQVPTDLQKPPSDNTSLGYNLYAVATADALDDSRSDLMMVNLNLSTAVTVNPRSNGLTPYYLAPTEVWEWSGHTVPGVDGIPTVAAITSAPTTEYFRGGVPGNWSLPPQTVALLERFAAPGVPLQFTESGLPLNYSKGTTGTAPTRWFLNVSGATHVANGTATILDFVPAGSYDLSVTTLPFPFNHTVSNPGTRYEPLPPSVVHVGADPVNVTFPFAEQYVLNVTNANPAEGSIRSFPSWTNASEPVPLSATPHPGYVFIHWFGNGIGHYNGTTANVTVTPEGRLRETAHFALGYSVTFRESGLPVGTPWEITIPIQNLTLTSDNSTNSVLERSLVIYAYLVGGVLGYRTLPTNSSFDVEGAPITIPISFIRLTPPAPTFPVTFAEAGLPLGSVWSITVRNVTVLSTAATLLVPASNGSYGYQTATIPGYRAHPLGDGFSVDGGPLTVIVQFAPVLYQIVWIETGLGSNLSWSVRLDGVADPARGSWTTAMVPNGTEAFVIPDTADYIPVPGSGTVHVEGANVTVRFQFLEAKFLVTFSTIGPVPTSLWRVRLSDTTVNSSTASLRFDEPNGTYTFDVTAPAGTFPTPSHGNVTVDAVPMVVPISLQSNGPGPIPPVWSLVRPALVDAVFMVAAAWVTFALVRRMRRST